MRGVSFECDRCRYLTRPTAEGYSNLPSPIQGLPDGWTFYATGGDVDAGVVPPDDSSGHLCPACSREFKAFRGSREVSS